MSRWFSSIQLAAVTTFSILLLTLNACAEITNDEDKYRLSVTARGLAANESIIVDNGSSVQINGNDNLSWTEAESFPRIYSESSADYTIEITRQPSNSNKVCRVLNPTGIASNFNSLIRIECGFRIVIVDLHPTDLNPTMTSDNGLTLSNGLQSINVNARTTLVTSLEHNIVQNPRSDNPDDKVLQIIPKRTTGGVFEKLYLEGDSVSISFFSTNQGCEITGANDPIYSFMIGSDTFTDTVRTIPLSNDWIENSSKFGEGRTCNNFSNGSAFEVEYAPTENPEGQNSYEAICYYPDPIQMSCGHALKVKVRGLDENLGEFITLKATRYKLDQTEVAHTLDLTANFSGSNTSRGMKTFNLAFEDWEDYEIIIENASGLTCTFDSSGIDEVWGSINSNLTEAIYCN